MSKRSRPLSYTSASIANWSDAANSGFPERRKASSQHGTSRAQVRESPEANKVTSWPRRTSSSVTKETMRSVPPYNLGGTLSYNGAS